MQENTLDLTTHRAEHSSVQVHPLAKPARPLGFDRAYVTARETPYEKCGTDGRPTGEGGVLPQGKIVWGRETVMTDGGESDVQQVHVAAGGLVLLNPRSLRVSEPPVAGTSA